ncbi:hypothetical protein Har1130_19075 [Haloarcula sp. CBA1130]|uniref:hypothetical protein n=1 Tax=unclassified Haloarcula TaxID=2624677 RepID=UPI0012465985|nr:MULTISPECIES: hypothetical protein [unclassified Haloarcula]KAA9396233.1 hypothetical protein Har1129_17790 [Haloarcula sp. CBA1129]KAA9396383.1 hypothetical protein Har1130_19075 [Haloarcula sp. CBA1130]KAA9397553.1 hypothetical protein Har1129_04540 [Haloarcula sp. CBA1129]
MPNEDDRFGDVAEQLKQTEDGEESDSTNRTDTENESQPDVERATEDTKTAPETETDSAQVQKDTEESTGGPAFSFDETDMHGFYVREETWNGVTQMRSSVTAACSMFDVPEFEGREFQDACLQVIADHGDEVALQVLRERGIEADEERVQEVVEMLSEQATND